MTQEKILVDTVSIPSQPTSELGLDSGSLLRAIYKTEHPEKLIRELPAQSLYMALQHEGLESSADVLALVTKDQYISFLDFELWNKDEFIEDRFWAWLSAVDEADSLLPLTRLENCLDSSLLLLMVRRHVSVLVFEDAEGNPPGPGFYTPDQGFTWLAINIEDEDRKRLFGKLLALIYQSSFEKFYQIIAEASARPSLELLEEAYQESSRRLSQLGIPDLETASRLNSGITRLPELEDFPVGSIGSHASSISDPTPLLLYEGRSATPVDSLITEIVSTGGGLDSLAQFEAEMALIVNAAIVYTALPYSEYEEVLSLCRKVKCTFGIGIELAKNESPGRSLLEYYQVFGAETLYRLGLGALFELRSKAKVLYQERDERGLHDSEVLEILEALNSPLPEVPSYFEESGHLSDREGRLHTGRRAIRDLRDLRAVSEFLTELF